MNADKPFNVSIKDIHVSSFFVRDVEAPSSDKINIQLRMEFMADVKAGLLIVSSTIRYALSADPKPGEEMMNMSYSFILKISSDGFAVKRDSGSYSFTFPEGFIETVIRDVYASGRILCSERLTNMRLRDVYLPVGGAEQIIPDIMKTIEIKVINSD